MIDAERLRVRVLTMLGAGLLATGQGCGKTADSTGGPEAVNGASGQGTATGAGAGKQSEAAGTLGSGDTGGSAGNGVSGGGGVYSNCVGFSAGNGGVPSIAGTPVMSPTYTCFTYAQIAQLVGTTSGDAAGAAGAGGATPTNGGGAANEAGAAAQEPGFMCPDGGTVQRLTGSGGQSLGPPISEPNRCCYETFTVGRPFVVEGAARTAASSSRGDWNAFEAGSDNEQAALDPETRAILARAWLADALAEHASIASFARLTLELLQHAAPPALVQQAQLAALDEIEHARLCFAQAARYAGVDHGPGPLSLEDALGPVDLPRLAASAVREGCVGETLAALLAAEQARSASDPRARAALLKIAEDEARHAELAWQIVRWSLSLGDVATRAAVAQAFEAATSERSAQAAAGEPAPKAEALRAHGRLSEVETTAVAVRGLRDVVTPCAQALLAA